MQEKLVNTPDDFDVAKGYEKPLREHIAELRKRTLYCTVFTIVLFFVIATNYSDTLMQYLAVPIKSRNINFIFLNLSEALTAKLKVSFIAAVIVSVPFIFWNIWSYVKPALYKNERKAVLLFTLSSVALFVAGVVFGYLVVFISSITFFVYMGQGIATPMLSISQYVGFLFGFIMAFGIVFELPIIIYALTKLGIVTADELKKWRKYIVFAIFILAAFLTPPDALSQLLMAGPMIILYEIGILVAKHTTAV